MKNTSRKPYIYKVTNCGKGLYYIGSQCSGKTIGVNYFTSSKNKDFKNDFKNHREKYKIEIIKEFEDPKECVRAENYIIRNHMILKDGLCLNRSYVCGGKKVFSRAGTHGWNKGVPFSEEVRKKMSATQKGRHHSEEVRKKISVALKDHTAWNKGVPFSEEVRKKMSATHKGLTSPNKGHHHSEEAKQKMSLASKRRIKISIEGRVFGSLNEAAKYYNVSISGIRYWLKTNKHNAVYI